jgi:hypothetical protein
MCELDPTLANHKASHLATYAMLPEDAQTTTTTNTHQVVLMQNPCRETEPVHVKQDHSTSNSDTAKSPAIFLFCRGFSS